MRRRRRRGRRSRRSPRSSPAGSKVLGVLERERVEAEDLAQDREIVFIRLVEVEPEEAPAREQLRDLLATEMHFGAAAIVDDDAGPRRAALGERRLRLELLAHERRLAGRPSASPQPPPDRTPDHTLRSREEFELRPMGRSSFSRPDGVPTPRVVRRRARSAPLTGSRRM